jgi:outer membrane protein TolC
VRFAFNDGERAYWDLQAAINEILATTESRYWVVVAALENLRVVSGNRKLVAEQVAATERLYKAELVTRYGKAQVDAELARVARLEETAKRDVLVASTRLASLLTDTRDAVEKVLFVPVDYTKHMGQALDLESTDVFATAAEHRPELRAAALDVERADINLRFAQTQVRPDLTVYANLNATQKGDVVGYNGLWESLGHVTEPDRRDFDVTVTYIRPWANRALKAQLAAATSAHDSAGLGLRDLENIVEQSVGDALAGVYTARGRVEEAQKNVAFAQDAYDRLLRRRETTGDVPEIQVVLNSQRLLQARAERIVALVDHKIAEAQLLAAQGVIANQYGQRLATSDFERYRIGLLAANDALRFFKPLRY